MKRRRTHGVSPSEVFIEWEFMPVARLFSMGMNWKGNAAHRRAVIAGLLACRVRNGCREVLADAYLWHQLSRWASVVVK